MDINTDPVENTISAITSLMHDTAKLDKVFDSTEVVRQKLSNKIMTAIEGMELDLNLPKPKELEAKLLAISTAAALLNDQDKQQLNRVKIKLAMKQEDTSKEVAKLVVDMLAKIQSNTCVFDEEANKKELESALANIEVSDTELREDSSDLT